MCTSISRSIAKTENELYMYKCFEGIGVCVCVCEYIYIYNIYKGFEGK